MKRNVPGDLPIVNHDVDCSTTGSAGVLDNLKWPCECVEVLR